MTLHSKREGIDAAQTRGTWIERDGMLWSSSFGLLGLVAGMSTRAQGSMAGSHHPLEEQAENRAAFARRLGFDAVARAKQVHGRDVAYVTAAVEQWPVADALWTDRRGVLLGIAAADCVPVLVADPRGPIGAAHAGWLGTSLDVVRALVDAMVAGGAVRERLVAAIGPSIGPCCYTIDAERAATVRERIGPDPLETRDGKTYFDLWSANEAQLRAAGVQRVEVARICTLSGGADLWSYRGRGPDGKYGTQLGFVGRR
jgi:purine-nucleoside/S-methyl-5'-thioadenosine phosphorylase / adenosine deaminase